MVLLLFGSHVGGSRARAKEKEREMERDGERWREMETHPRHREPPGPDGPYGPLDDMIQQWESHQGWERWNAMVRGESSINIEREKMSTSS